MELLRKLRRLLERPGNLPRALTDLTADQHFSEQPLAERNRELDRGQVPRP
jgi:hypothetical protein